MEAMLLEENPAALARLAAALAEAGFEVTLAEDVRAAKAALRRGIHDVLVLSERVGGRLAHDVALLAELRNPGLGTILVTDRAGPRGRGDLRPPALGPCRAGPPDARRATLGAARARRGAHRATRPRSRGLPRRRPRRGRRRRDRVPVRPRRPPTRPCRPAPSRRRPTAAPAAPPRRPARAARRLHLA